MAEFKVSPTASVEQGGFSSEKGGNLRDHNGCCADSKAIAATAHYDGDYGTRPTQAATGPLATGPAPGSVVNPIARGPTGPAQPPAPVTLQSVIHSGPAPVAPNGRDAGDRAKPKFNYVGGGTRG